jgi:uncharacterized protein (DUF427 family)
MNQRKPVAQEAHQESVWDYPRPPRLEDSTRHVQIVVDGKIIADSVWAKRVLETSHPPVYYIPLEDIDMALLRAISGGTWCEWKGEASYFDMIIGNRVIPRVAWTYSNPTARFDTIQHYIAFYPSKMDHCTVDGEKVRAQEGDFYGGWITPDIVGPFKGAPGTMGW